MWERLACNLKLCSGVWIVGTTLWYFSAVLVNSYLLQSIMYYQSEIKCTVRALDQLIELPTVWIINRP
jgi:hypothetical protein